MADNVGYTPGSGSTIATDEAGDGSQVQLVKLAYSGDGVRTCIAADADGLKVNLGKSVDVTVLPKGGQVYPVSDNGGSLTIDAVTLPLPTGAATETTLAAVLAALVAGITAAITGTVPVSDASGSLTVDGGVTAAQGAAAAVASAWPVKISDGSSSVGISAVGADKALKVDVIQSVGDAATKVDKAAFTEGTSTVTPIAGIYNETLGADPSEDQAAAIRTTAKRSLHVSLRAVAGTAIGVANAPVVVAFDAHTRVTKSVTLGVSETGTTIWDPAGGKSFVVTDVIIACLEAGRLTLFDSTDSAANRLFDAFTYGSVIHLNFQARPWVSAAADNILKATTDADAEAIVTVHGYEV